MNNIPYSLHFCQMDIICSAMKLLFVNSFGLLVDDLNLKS